MTILNQVTPITISSLPAATALSGNEAVPIVQLGATVQVPIVTLPTGFGGATGTFTSGSHTLTIVNGIITIIS